MGTIDARGPGPFSQDRLTRVLAENVEGRPLYGYVCPDDAGPFNARLAQADVEGRDLYVAVPCNQSSSSSSGSALAALVASSSSSSDGGGHRMARLIAGNVEGRPLYAPEEPCCPSVSDSSGSGSSKSSSSQPSTSSSSAQSGSAGSDNRSASRSASRSAGSHASGSGGPYVPCCPNYLLPTNLTAVITDDFAGDPDYCHCIPEVKIGLTWTPNLNIAPGTITPGWRGQFTNCEGRVMVFVFYCVPATGANAPGFWRFGCAAVPEINHTCGLACVDPPVDGCRDRHIDNCGDPIDVRYGARYGRPAIRISTAAPAGEPWCCPSFFGSPDPSHYSVAVFE